MEEDSCNSSNAFSTGKSAQEKGLPCVPDCYQIPPSNHPSLCPEVANVPVVDLCGLRQGSEQRSIVVDDIRNSCRHLGFFQIVNHGICQSVLDGALSMAFEFFKMPAPEKMKYMSNDVHKPVRYGTSLKDGVNKVQFSRVFLKHYSHPLEDWIGSWPDNPPNYRENMGRYWAEVMKLGLKLFEATTEALGLGPTYLTTKMENGMQVMVINCDPPCPQPDITLGLPPHSDYSCFTILLQSSSGLQIMDTEDGRWRLVPDIRGALQVHVGDHLEVAMVYKSVFTLSLGSPLLACID
ncbi:hypothetical protein FNV43_RR24305 [Rhamnella rubrinervis]|uniref:Fe2OG dioxygenase domain-containing protein n=1 Tax=Rhamnella rubrinervis TaxID=2594499 RepID=A0A8K0DS59_9ROSA|nr:hypothetical protein FNV43_RR24305 [Rhamnella rubrinervis]